MFRTLMLSLALVQAAACAVINFEDLPSTNSLPGPLANPAALLSTQLSPLGVVFGRPGVSAGVSVVNNTSSVSAPNAIVGLDENGHQVGWSVGDIYFRFVSPGTLTPSVTDFVSFSVGDAGLDLDNFIIRAYDLSDNLIDIQFISDTAFQVYSLAMPGIHRIEVDFLPIYADGLGGYQVDDLTFNAPASVPEPSTMMLCGGVLLAIGYRRRKPVSRHARCR